MNECLLAGGGGAVLELALGLGLLLFAAERDTDTRRAGNEPSRILNFHLLSFSWLRAPPSTFTFKNLLRHYIKQALDHGK